MLNIQDLKGNRLKKSLSLFQAIKRYHNRNNSGGNFAVNLYFDEKHSKGLSFEISGYHDTTGAITEIRFGYLWELGAKLEAQYIENYDTLITCINDILRGLSLFANVQEQKREADLFEHKGNNFHRG